jgi:UPF0755 protein
MSIRKILILAGAIIVIALLAIYYFAFSSPSNFTPGTTVLIESGQSISGISQLLEDEHVVRSTFVLRSLLILFGGEHNTSAGLYVFASHQNVFSIAMRIRHGEYGYIPVKMTIPEGFTTAQIADLTHQLFPNIDRDTFYAEIKPDEGYLFPDTYFFPPEATPLMIEDRLKSEFSSETDSLAPEIAAQGKTLQQIITMASILEAEVQTDSDRKLVADILWRRINIGMRLQVDSTLSYILGKTSAELTDADLKTDSPYNTYLNAGLPPTPISNPGIEAIQAALNPTPNNYLYFLSDGHGITHFAVTYAEHVQNKQKYLK